MTGEETDLPPLQSLKSHRGAEWALYLRKVSIGVGDARLARAVEEGLETACSAAGGVAQKLLPWRFHGALVGAFLVFMVYHTGGGVLFCKPGALGCLRGKGSPFQSDFVGPAVHEFALNSKVVSRLVIPRPSEKLRQRQGVPEAPSPPDAGPQVPTAEMAPMKEMPAWFREATQGEHVPDRRPVRALRKLMSAIAVDNTVIIVSTNLGFFNMSLNLLCRLRDVGVTNVLTWALDRHSAEALRERGVPYYYDNSRFSVSKYTSYFDLEYIRMMIERAIVWWRLLATGYDLLFLDSDVVLFENPMTVFPRYADIEGQIDARYWPAAERLDVIPDMCAGAFWLRSGLHTLKFLDSMKRAIERHALKERYDDQYALNSIIRDPREAVVLNRGPSTTQVLREGDVSGRLRVLFVEPARIMGGRLEKLSEREVDPLDSYNVTFVYRSKRAPDLERRVRPGIFHLNGRGLEYIKKKMLKKAGWWEVTEDGRCRTRAGMLEDLKRRREAGELARIPLPPETTDTLEGVPEDGSEALTNKMAHMISGPSRTTELPGGTAPKAQSGFNLGDGT